MNIQQFKYLLLALSLGTVSETFAAQYVRYNVNSIQGQANLKAMEMAFWKMKQMGCADPRSWYYQGAIHQVPQNLKTNPDCPDFVIKNNQPPVLKTAWSNCTHASSHSPQRPASDLNFLLWHRLYTARLEAVVRQLSGKTDFTIPYFDYQNIQALSLPPLLRNSMVPAQPVSLTNTAVIPAHQSALYTPARRQNMNAGQTIDVLEAATLNRAITALDNNSLFMTFSNAINQSPHGEMHDYLGGDGQGIDNPILQTSGKDSSGLMANVSSAGFDPVFWLHHAAIDRLWAKWDVKNKNNPYARPSLQTLQQQQWPFVFFDANGQAVRYRTAQEIYRAVYMPDYRYDDMPPQLLEQAGNPADKAKNSSRPLVKSVVLEQTLASPLTSQRQTISVTTSTQKSPFRFLRQLKQRLTARSAQAWTLDLALEIKGNPVNSYQVFLVQDNQRHFIGVINFFGLEHQAHAHAMPSSPEEMTAHSMMEEKNFEVSPFFQHNQPFSLEISPVDGSSNEDAVIIRKIQVSAYQTR